ncbi:MAG: aminopeptidase P family protein [Bacteroidales bacterium]|nr:aminopeptidase P family protein [Bacteroidales bacterium]
MKQEISQRIAQLRQQMQAAGVDAAIIPQTDPHQSEYIADHWQVRRYLSGFTGSAGTLVVTADKALLWTDSRYFIQAAQQLEGTEIEMMKDGIAGTPSIEDYLIQNLKPGMTVGVDGMLFSAQQAQAMRKAFEKHGLKFVTDFDVIDEIWPDRPSLPKDKVFVHAEEYAGESAKSKLARILADAKRQDADAAFISPLDEIAWALNIRCKDVKYNPVTTSYLYVSPEGSTLLVDEDKITPEVSEYLKSQGVDVYPYAKVKEFIAQLPDKKVLIEEARTSTTLTEALGDRAVMGSSAVAVPKGVKNETQIAGIRTAMERDGAALVRAFMAIEDALAKGEKITELDVDRLLVKYRSEMKNFFDESFGSIIGYGPHGAIVHYEPTVETDATLEPNGLLLVDSGAQYLDGTTDITRTVALGKPTQQEKHDFTLVMKGHIALGDAVFPVDTRGAQLDVLARQFLWKEGLAYLHGTGHGVGHFLNVHEGPQTIRLNNTPIPLMEGMITSNEPGLYRENVHGVRCENLVLTVKAMTTEFGEFLKFETLTLFPFDRELFETEIMSDDEIKWVNDYHAEVYRRVSPLLNEAERAWLEAKTAPITK